MTQDCLDLLSTADADKRLSKDINVIGVEKNSFESLRNVPSPTYQKEGRPFEVPTSILKR